MREAEICPRHGSQILCGHPSDTAGPPNPLFSDECLSLVILSTRFEGFELEKNLLPIIKITNFPIIKSIYGELVIFIMGSKFFFNSNPSNLVLRMVQLRHSSKVG